MYERLKAHGRLMAAVGIPHFISEHSGRLCKIEKHIKMNGFYE